MRKSTYVVLASMALWAATAASACGSDVTNNSGGMGGKETTSSTQSSSSSSSSGKSSSSSSSSVSSSSSGGGDNCMMACDHVQMCVGIDACAMLPPLDCKDPQTDCAAQCVLATPCNMIGLGTLQTCQAQCSGDGGMLDGGMSDGGMLDGSNPQVCGMCAQSQCLGPLAACSQNNQCTQWVMCLLGCAQDPNPTACSFACDSMYSGAAGQYTPVYSCVCNNCLNDCKAYDPCSHIPG